MTRKRQRDAALILVAGIWLSCFTVAAFGEIGPPIEADKKLIGFAINSADAGYLREHVADVERLPLDGLILFVYPDDWTGPRSEQEGMFFGGRRFTFEDFGRDLADLQATAFKRFTDNFIQVETSARGSAATGREADGNLDWFDPAWDGIAENGRVVAEVAKAAGFKGIMLDIELYRGSLGPWGGKSIFSYADSPSKDQYTLEQTAQQIQRRGRQFMAAVTEAYPDITILIIQNTGWGGADLVEYFVRGMLEARGRATVIDGGEDGYPQVTPVEFAAHRGAVESRHRQEEIFAPIQYAFGVWVDYMPNQFGGWHTDPADFHRNYRTPQELEKTLYGALAASDKYVWLYTWHSAVWYTPIVRPRPQPGQCVLCPHGLVPDAYLEAMVSCRKPHDLAWSPQVPSDRYFYFDAATLTEGQAADGPNLLENGVLKTGRMRRPRGPWGGWLRASSRWRRSSRLM